MALPCRNRVKAMLSHPRQWPQPIAQEKALTDYLGDIEHQLRVNGSLDFAGRTIDGLHDRFQLSRAGLVAAAHREGARETRAYLKRIEENGFSSRGLMLNNHELAVETRLHTFADLPYN
jgi:hypothetical protein